VKPGKLLVICLCMFVALMACTQQHNPVHEQTSFTESEPMDRPVPIPQKVLKLLLQREEVKDNLRMRGETEAEPKAQFFSASKIHLGPADEMDLIIKGNEEMGGADNAWFWVVRSADKSPAIVLWAGGDGFYILTSKSNGYRDIQTNWASPSEQLIEIYKFDGTKYKLAKSRRKKLN
jgi:hypothetical protein